MKYPLYDCSVRLDGKAGSVVNLTHQTAAEILILNSMHILQGEPFMERSIRPTLDIKGENQEFKEESPTSLFEWLRLERFAGALTREGDEFVKGVIANAKALPVSLDDIKDSLATDEGNQPYLDADAFEDAPVLIDWQAMLSNGIAQVKSQMPIEKAEEIEAKRPDRVSVEFGGKKYKITLGDRVGYEPHGETAMVTYEVGKPNSKVKHDAELKKALGASGG